MASTTANEKWQYEKMSIKATSQNLIVFCSWCRKSMRSKSDGVESRTNGVIRVPQDDHDISQERELGLPVKRPMAKVQLNEAEDKVEVTSDKGKLLIDYPAVGEKREDIMDLSKMDLLKLLGIMEGEVQVSGLLLPIQLVSFVTFGPC